MKYNPIDFELADLAYSFTESILKKHGNRISSDQSNELHKVIGTAATTISLQRDSRHASPLPCGAGKTTVVRGLIKATHDLNRDYRIVVCAEKVEALCELMRDLTNEDGVPRDKITLIHGYTHDPKFNLEAPIQDTASERSDDWNGDHQQFLLLTHSKLQHGSNKLDYDLMIYDETLLLGEVSTIPLADLAGEIGKFIDKVEAYRERATDDQRKLLPWLQATKCELKKTREEDDAILLEVEPLPIGIREARAADRPVHGNDTVLRDFMGMVYDKADIRVLEDCNQGQALVTYQQTIPNDLNKMLILDASHNIRKLTGYDNSIKVVTPFTNIKDHSSVTAYVHKTKAGRQSIMAGLQGGKDLPLFDEVAALVARKLKAGKKVLAFTFKDYGKAHPVSVLKQKIADELGMDPGMLSSGGEVRFLTWGHETAINRHSDCDTVVFAGLLTLPTAEVAGRIFAQSTDIRRQITSAELSEVVHSEKVHSLYQALSRGSCRIMKDGKAGSMDAYIFTHDHIALRKSLKAAMPGIRFERYNATCLENEISKLDQCKEKLYDYLETLKNDTISKVALFKACVPSFKTDTRTKALKELLKDELAFDWQSNNKSIVRII